MTACLWLPSSDNESTSSSKQSFRKNIQLPTKQRYLEAKYGSPHGSNNNTNRTNSFAASTNYLQIWPTFYYLFTATLSSRLIKAIKIVKPRTTAQPTNGYQPTTKLRVFIPPESLTDQFRWGMSVDIALHQRPRPSFAAKKAVRHMVVGAPDFSPMFNYWQTSFTSPSDTRSTQDPKLAAVCHFCRKIIFILPAMGRLASCTRTPIQLVSRKCVATIQGDLPTLPEAANMGLTWAIILIQAHPREGGERCSSNTKQGQSLIKNRHSDVLNSQPRHQQRTRTIWRTNRVRWS